MAVEQQSDNLPIALQEKLRFTPDPSQKWLINDVINDRPFYVGGPHLYEFLPAVGLVFSLGGGHPELMYGSIGLMVLGTFAHGKAEVNLERKVRVIQDEIASRIKS